MVNYGKIGTIVINYGTTCMVEPTKLVITSTFRHLLGGCYNIGIHGKIIGNLGNHGVIWD